VPGVSAVGVVRNCTKLRILRCEGDGDGANLMPSVREFSRAFSWRGVRISPVRDRPLIAGLLTTRFSVVMPSRFSVWPWDPKWLPTTVRRNSRDRRSVGIANGSGSWRWGLVECLNVILGSLFGHGEESAADLTPFREIRSVLSSAEARRLINAHFPPKLPHSYGTNTYTERALRMRRRVCPTKINKFRGRG
jgi:hypothetical protein